MMYQVLSVAISGAPNWTHVDGRIVAVIRPMPSRPGMLQVLVERDDDPAPVPSSPLRPVPGRTPSPGRPRPSRPGSAAS